jgi:hypothetical protein
VTAAHQAGRPVSSRHVETAVAMAIAAGCDSIEHGYSWARELRCMGDHGIVC